MHFSLVMRISKSHFLFNRMCTASAQSLAIRKLLTKSAYDSTIAPGPPLPKSHPSPALIAKLHLEAAHLCSSALSLARIPGSSKARLASASGKLGNPFKKDKDSQDAQKGEMDVSADLLRFLADSSAYHSALAHKWLGVDAGETPGSTRLGEAVAFLAWSKKELDELKDAGKGGGKEDGKEGKRDRKERVVEKIESVSVFLKHYKKLNNSVSFFLALFSIRVLMHVPLASVKLSFQPVPSQSSLQSSIPAGRLAVAVKPFAKPVPAFGPGSIEYTRKRAEELELVGELAPRDIAESVPAVQASQSYAGAGSYF